MIFLSHKASPISNEVQVLDTIDMFEYLEEFER